MSDESVKTSSQKALEEARENIDLWRDLASTDLPIAPYAQNLVHAVEEEFDDV